VAVAALLALLAPGPVLAGCQSGVAGDWHAAAVPSPTPSPTAASPAASPSPAGPTGPMYAVTADLCRRISFSPLGNWLVGRPGYIYGEPEVRPQQGVDELDCDFKGFLDSHRLVTEVDADLWVYDSVADARSAFTTFDSFQGAAGRFDVTTADYDRSFTGYGGDANGYYWSGAITSPVPYTDTSYLIVLLKGNVVVGVYVDVQDYFSRKYSKQTMESRVGKETKAIAALLHKA
jgi:hypothetical protein